MTDPVRNARRPRGVRVAVLLILLSALANIAVYVVVMATEGPSGAQHFARFAFGGVVWAGLAAALYYRRRWALVVATVLTAVDFLYSQRQFESLAAATPRILLAIAVDALRIFALVRLLAVREWFLGPESGKSRPTWMGASTLAVVLALQLGLIVRLGYRLATSRLHGDLGLEFVLVLYWAVYPTMIALAVAALFIRGSRRFRWGKVAAIVLAVATPFAAWSVAPAVHPLAQRRYDAEQRRNAALSEAYFKRENQKSAERNEAKAKARLEALPAEAQRAAREAPKRYLGEVTQGQTAELGALAASPQTVKVAGDWYLVLENKHLIKVYGMDRTRERRRAFEAYAQKTLVGKSVEIRLPDDYLDRYRIGHRYRRDLEAPMDNLGHTIGDVDGLIFVGGRLINLDYCKAELRARLFAYQEAYNRGDL